jgi:hypothetical protein
MMQSTKDVVTTKTTATNTPKGSASTGTTISPLTPFTSQKVPANRHRVTIDISAMAEDTHKKLKTNITLNNSPGTTGSNSFKKVSIVTGATTMRIIIINDSDEEMLTVANL